MRLQAVLRLDWDYLVLVYGPVHILFHIGHIKGETKVIAVLPINH